MRYIPLLFLCVVLLATAVLSLRLPAKDFPWLAVVYLLCLLVFHVVALLSLQKGSFQSESYANLYRWSLRISMVLGAALALHFNRIHESDNALLLLIAAIVLGIAERGTQVRHLVHHIGGPLHTSTNMLSVQSVVLLSCGVLILSSLHANVSLGSLAVRFAFGGYALTQGLVVSCLASGAVRNSAFWKPFNGWLPAAPGLVCFTLLCVFIVSRQGETARQHAQDEQISELQWEQP